ncbi:MAG: FlgD immunoglobulin-like domain containing protein, partial [Candidatus Marinimicrobia bacterium]|nr:FlgD immunoglobulin-like domain containing protein [Candidatus Neomarinimicrobiota bacterium]
VDDSGWDYDPEYETGRLVFEVDNRCIPDNTTQRVNTFWTYAGSAAEVDEDAPIAEEFTLHGNYPNPFNPETKIRFATERASDVKVTIYSILGEEVSVAHDGQLSSGTYDITWYGQDSRGNKVPSGVYFYEVRSDDRIQKGKMLLLK